MKYEQLTPDPWEKCRSWISPRDGSAVELVILDMKPDRAGEVAAILENKCRLARRNEDPECERCRLDLWEPARQLACAQACSLAAVACFEHKPIHLYFTRTADKLDLEIFFWPDLMLADTAPPARSPVFPRLVQFALDICDAGQGGSVLITPQQAGDLPRPESIPAHVIWKQFSDSPAARAGV